MEQQRVKRSNLYDRSLEFGAGTGKEKQSI
ncbi:hypothetical protein J2S19_000498 [Metabacillus malikii]|uniref:Uncharacterized protein n=1 Tax=Metabacillus malikii TaxID=1504265 RepID=A0ABT9ZAK6_9BACI|nr:hypothetical protein [Metabacillus malikii]